MFCTSRGEGSPSVWGPLLVLTFPLTVPLGVTDNVLKWLRRRIFHLVSECSRAGTGDKNRVEVLQVILQPTSTENLTAAPSAMTEFDTHLIHTHTHTQAGGLSNKHKQEEN